MRFLSRMDSVAASTGNRRKTAQLSSNFSARGHSFPQNLTHASRVSHTSAVTMKFCNLRVGRVTPCAPFGELTTLFGAHGVTRPTRFGLGRQDRDGPKCPWQRLAHPFRSPRCCGQKCPRAKAGEQSSAPASQRTFSNSSFLQNRARKKAARLRFTISRLFQIA